MLAPHALVLLLSSHPAPQAADAATDLRPRTLHEVRGHARGDRFGLCVAAGGDIDGDGVGDFLVGACDPLGPARGLLEKRKTKPRDGYVQAFSGASGKLLRTYRPKRGDPLFGISVASAGDVDGDGRADVVVGNPDLSPSSEAGGRAYVFSGARGSLLATLRDPRSGMGLCVAGVGDLDGDGVGDIAVGSPQSREGGTVVAWSGKDWQPLWRLDSGDEHTHGATSICVVGDVDGDGTADLALGDGSSTAASGEGEVDLVSGRTGTPLRSWRNKLAYDGLGLALAAVGDVDADGRGDLLACAPRRQKRAGGAFVYSCQDGRLLLTIAGFDEGVQLGVACAALGDVDGDGVPDLALATAPAQGGAGRVLVCSGRDGGTLAALEGLSLAALGDLDGDGYAELALGQESERDGRGVVRVVSLR